MSNLLTFHDVDGTWNCGTDFADVKLTRVQGPYGVTAIVFVCNIQIDVDGAPTAYGPPNVDAIDRLSNAKSDANLWVGVASLKADKVRELHTPNQAGPHHKHHVVDMDVQIDQQAALRDANDAYPVWQKAGPYQGFYVSQTSHHANPQLHDWEQAKYIDASTVAYGVLTSGLKHLKLKLGDQCATLRVDKNLQSIYSFADGGPRGKHVGECSYKVFTDVGGVRQSRGVFANNFLVCHIAVLNSADTTFEMAMTHLASAKNAGDLALLIAYQMGAGPGGAGRELLRQYQNSTDFQRLKRPTPPLLGAAITSLRGCGYHFLERGDFVPMRVAAGLRYA